MISGVAGHHNDDAWLMAQKLNQDQTNLSTALQNGDLSTAQTAFNNILSIFNNQNPNSTTPSTSATPSATAGVTGMTSSNFLQNDLNSLAQALQAGNLTDAQNDLTKLQTDMQAQAKGHQHHHHHHQNSQSVSNTANSNSPATLINTVNVTT